MTTTLTPVRNDIHRAANALIDDMPRSTVLKVSTFGYRGALPEGVGQADDTAVRSAMRDIAVCIAHGAVRP